MTGRRGFSFALSLPLLLALGSTAHGADVVALKRSFEQPPDDARIMMRWWWFGPAVTKSGIERELILMKQGGIGGVEIQPVYPLALDDEQAGIRNLPFLSDEFLQALGFASEKARALGLRVDLTLGSGWPFGGPQIPIAHAAGQLRLERVRTFGDSLRVAVPNVVEGERLIAAFAAPTRNNTIDVQGLREVTDIHDSALWLPKDIEGPAEVFFFIASRTGMMVKRAALGSEGFVLDHYDRAGLDRYLTTVGEPLVKAFGAHPPYAIFCDSLEVYGSDWTGDLLDEFKQRRGYDLRPRLPALAIDGNGETADIRYDWGRTLTELLEERFLAPLQTWSKAHGVRFRVQGYGVPPASIASNAYSDLSEGEGADWKNLTASRWASSAGHIFGQPVTSSETWTWLHSPSFRATPLDVKVEADRHFLQGVNQLIGHGWPYTAEGAPDPGWRFYAAGVFNDRNPWWIVMPDLALYLQRISHLMRQGAPVSDVALYLPTSDAYAQLKTPNRALHLLNSLRERVGNGIIPLVLESGFGFDLFDDGALAKTGRVESGALLLGKNRYRVVILPGVERIPAATLRKLDEFSRSGGILIATRRQPARAPGLLTSAAERAEVRDTSKRLFAGPNARGRFVAEEQTLREMLPKLLTPDVAFAPAAPQLGFTHRSVDGVELYLIVNTDNTRQVAQATFRVRGLQAELWDPLSGQTTQAEVVTRGRATTTVALALEPYASVVVVFSQEGREHRPGARQVANEASSVDLSDGWSVAFGPQTASVAMDRLRSWTEDEATRFFSGSAVYEREVSVADALLAPGRRLVLDFGQGQPLADPGPRARVRALLDPPIREAAVVLVNDKRAGSLWCPPYTIDVTGLLRPGANRVRVQVANLAINRLAGERLPDYRLLNLRYGERFKPQDMDDLKPLPSGMLGEVRLVAIDAAESR